MCDASPCFHLPFSSLSLSLSLSLHLLSVNPIYTLTVTDISAGRSFVQLMAAGPVSPKDHQATPPVVPVLMMEDVIAKDVILAWFREEFTAANTIIDALCSHLAQLGSGSEYEAVFTAILGGGLTGSLCSRCRSTIPLLTWL
jgi:hypothetical protein